MRYLNLKEKLDVTRVVVAILLLFVATFGFFNHSDGWGWFLAVGLVLYPTSINIDFREYQDED